MNRRAHGMLYSTICGLVSDLFVRISSLPIDQRIDRDAGLRDDRATHTIECWIPDKGNQKGGRQQ